MGAKGISAEALEHWRNLARGPLSTDTTDTAGQHPAAPQAEAEGATPQRRRTARQKTLIGGKVVFNEMMSVYDCAIRDLSETGARLKLNAPVQVPQVFMLRFGDGRVRRCTVRRRNALELGVEFLD